jgi:hypothetical protein
MRRRFTMALAICPIVIWVLYGLLGKLISWRVAAHYGPRILAIGDGKFAHADKFVHLRMKDFAVLVTAACLLALALMVAGAVWRRRVCGRAQWILQALGGFICLNCFAAFAGHTVLFWCVLFTGARQTHNYTQYQIKQGLMKEIDAPRQAVLLGSSQTRAEIDEGVLNNHLGARIWTTELHFPGSRAYDMILNLERLPPVKVDYVICYLSEGYFYTGVDSDAMMFFFGFRDLAEYRRLRRTGAGLGRNSILGLLGDAVPLFRCREPLAGRILGFRALNISQERYNRALSMNLAQRAKSEAASFRISADSDFQKRAFMDLAQKCRDKHSRLIVCCGQVNPILEKTLDPALRPDMLAFLRDRAAHDANIVLLDEGDLPSQTDADYDDLTHVNTAAQARFSEYIAGVLDKLARQNQKPKG